MSKRCEKCGDSFLCAEHAQVQCGLSCPPDWPGHWRDWHSEDHNCATKGRAAAAKRESTGGTTTELIAALRQRLAAAEKKLELKWLIEEQLGAALARAETAERELDEALRRVDIAHEGTGNAWAETERQHEKLAVCQLMLDSIEGLATGQPGVDPTEVADGWSTALAAVKALLAERDRLREALERLYRAADGIDPLGAADDWWDAIGAAREALEEKP